MPKTPKMEQAHDTSRDVVDIVWLDRNGNEHEGALFRDQLQEFSGRRTFWRVDDFQEAK